MPPYKDHLCSEAIFCGPLGGLYMQVPLSVNCDTEALVGLCVNSIGDMHIGTGYPFLVPVCPLQVVWKGPMYCLVGNIGEEFT